MIVQAAEEIGARLLGHELFRPAAFDIGDDRPDIGAVEDIAIAAHGGLEGAPLEAFATVADIIEQFRVRMLPGMAGMVLQSKIGTTTSDKIEELTADSFNISNADGSMTCHHGKPSELLSDWGLITR